jgi:hypothetical protein
VIFRLNIWNITIATKDGLELLALGNFSYGEKESDG